MMTHLIDSNSYMTLSINYTDSFLVADAVIMNEWLSSYIRLYQFIYSFKIICGLVKHESMQIVHPYYKVLPRKDMIGM